MVVHVCLFCPVLRRLGQESLVSSIVLGLQETLSENMQLYGWKINLSKTCGIVTDWWYELKKCYLMVVTVLTAIVPPPYYTIPHSSAPFHRAAGP